tara:strand:+ start:40 stop:1248 length:1209 start_codon:yes stop_codon:yes gene_type:complete
MNDFVDTLTAQGITAQSQKFKKFMTRQVENLSGGASSRGPAPSVNNNLTRHSTEHLEFPLNVSSADPGIGNHGHYIMFYINAQEKAKLDTSGRTDRGSVVDDPSQQYNIPKFINEWDSVTQTYKKQSAQNLVNKVVNNSKTDPIAQREGRVTAPADATEYKGKGSSIRIKRAPTKRLKTGIAMYMPAQVEVSYKTDYSDTPMGAVTGQALNAYNAALSGDGRGFRQNVVNMDQGAIELAQQAALGIAGSIPGMAGVKEAFEMKEGVIISDRLELAFKGVGKRDFTYNFKMIPKNQDEADMIRKIIFAFKANMLPEFEGGNRAGRRLIVPNTFDIQYMYVGKTNEYLHNISTCVLQDMTVQYGGSRYKTFDANSEGAPPVETSLSLNFQEMELITRERIFEGF